MFLFDSLCRQFASPVTTAHALPRCTRPVSFSHRQKFLGAMAVAAVALAGCSSKPMTTTNPRSQPLYVKGVPSYYIVKSGDTVSKIATQYGLDYRRVGALNGLDGNYTIYPGQRLILSTNKNPTSYRPTPVRPVTVNQPRATPVYPTSQPTRTPSVSQAPLPNLPTGMASQNWLRPTTGNLLRPFNQPAGVLGMWFGGQQGANVVASQAGTVLYVGSDLPEYGKLVLVQHNNDYISAYAQLGQILVQERQTIQAGRAVGTLGVVSTLNQPAMEFQIRYRGTPVNPANFLK